MCEIGRIEETAKEKGLSLSFVSTQLGLRRTYLKDVKAGRSSITADRLAQIAEILGTTPEYLCGKTDIKEKPSLSEELTDEEYEMLRLWRAAPSDKRRSLALEILKED